MPPRRSARNRPAAAGNAVPAGQNTQSSSQTPDDTVAPRNSSQQIPRLDLPPIANVYQAFKDMLSKQKHSIDSVAGKGGFDLRVATICSGTEAPIFALKLIKEIARLATDGRPFIEFNHLFSVENEPFKQAYISRNAPGSIVFRDVVDFADRDATAAPTILGDHCDIPQDIDLLIAGTSCVDFSSLNSQKRNSVKLMSTGTALFAEWKASHPSLTDRRRNRTIPSLRQDFFEDFRAWIGSTTPSEIQAADCGESSSTFLSAVCYINNHRPRMVILENVQMAPWDAICGLFLHGIDYAATHVGVDTKDYYVPQTRIRGYVVAIDRQVFGDSAEHVIAEWKSQLAAMKRAASTPMQQWLLSPHDPLTIRARQDESEKAIASSLKPNRETDWGRSKKRHSRVRRLLKLGKGRPVTAWGSGGYEKPYDRLDRLFIKSQRTRALDCTDIYFLQCLHGRFISLNMDASRYHDTSTDIPTTRWDFRFKSQAFDLSQNVDRGHINRNFGIMGCLTPRGMNLLTDEGRLLTGFEALNLQGLPLRDLDLTRESQDELRDLAGNAMSTTVVGAAILSLLFGVARHCSEIKPPPLKPIKTAHHCIPPYQPLYRPAPNAHEQAWDSAPESFCSMQTVLDIAKRCRRYCYCNGGAKYSTDELVQCNICEFTRCTSCAGNPKHQFGSSWSMKDPIMNDIAPQEIMDHFPTALTKIIGDAIVQIPSRPYYSSPELQSQLLYSLRSASFYYARTLISENLTIYYSAKDEDCTFDLRAVISDREITWYLFLDPWSVCGQLLCKKLGMPPARMSRPFGRVRIHPSAKEFIPGQNAWEFWVFDEVNLDCELTYDNNSIQIANKSPLESLPTSVHEDIQSIVGIYDHHPECDAAENSLHVSRQRPKRYMFKDPTKTGAPEEDCYIISDQCKLLDRHEFRDFCIKFLPTWYPEVENPRPRIFMEGYWKGAVTHSTHGPATHQYPLVHYIKQAGSRCIPSGSELQLNTEHHKVRTLASVSIHSNMLDETHMTLSKYTRVGPDSWALVLRSDYSSLFDLLAPANVNLKGIDFQVEQTFVDNCSKCCPPRPRVHWMEKPMAENKKSDTRCREPYSVSRDIRVYETELRKVGEPLQVAVNIKDAPETPGHHLVAANYEVNVDLLRHRAAHHLPRSNTSDEVFSIKTTVSVKRGSLNIPNLKFTSFKNSLHRLSGERNGNPRKVFVGGYTLSKQQEVSLDWMLEKENDSSLYTEREIEECRFDPLNLRVLAVAERDVKRPGGILADDVGYGKTVISLALMQAQQDFDQRRLSDEKKNDTGDTSPLAASLVLAPRHLVNQWEAEAAKFLGWKKPDVLVIKTSTRLQGMLKKAASSHSASSHAAKRLKPTAEHTSIYDELHAAKLIIVSTAVFDDKYYTSLGKYAGSLAQPRVIPKTTSTKDTSNPNVLGAFQDWYEDATTYARRHLSGFNPAIFNKTRLEIIRERHKSLQDSWKEVVDDYYDVSTRLGCQTVRNDRTGKLVNGKETGATVHREYNDEARAYTLTEDDFTADAFVHVLEAFSYSRIIYDEFSYENFCVAQFIKNARAHAKWVLSATPPTSNVKAVCDIGELLGIHVARPVKQRPGLPLITEGPALLRLNSTEEQLSYGKLYTDESVYERVQTAHNFLRHLASANPFDEEGMGKIQVREQIICSNMTRFEFARYHDLQRDLRNSELDFSKLLKRDKLDSETVNDFPEEGGARAGIALAWIASVDCADIEDDDVMSLRSSQTQSLVEAQAQLKLITDVAIWLVLRRFQEVHSAKEKGLLIKKNESVSQYIEEFSCHIEAILGSDPDDFDGVDGLQAIAHCIEQEQLTECSQWLANIDARTRTTEEFYEDLFTRLSQQIQAGVSMIYFQLPAAVVALLESSETLGLIRELGGHDYQSLTLAEARRYLVELVAEAQPSTYSQPRKSRKASDDGVNNDDRPCYPLFHTSKKIRGGNYTGIESELSDAMMLLDGNKEEVLAASKRDRTASSLFSSSDERRCDACGERDSDLRFLPDCGHLICSKHLEVGICGRIISAIYPTGSGCPSIIRNSSIPMEQIDRCPLNPTPAREEIRRGKRAYKKVPKASPKSHEIAGKISEIFQSGDDKILLFYQFEEQRKHIDDLLRADAHVGNWEEDDRVRMLKLNSEEAAGSNFQDANHVMFTNTPIFGKQEDFDKYVKQAKGRAIRHGQKKAVDVYYFVTANTFEVDLLQLRTRRSIKLGEGGVAYLVDPKDGKDTNGDAGAGEAEASC
ncbi:hypothetical protein F5Y08DRAFT_355183 [Xylaria arbuscula]|nr:hypothetical protein F5Y08DRAFT_355183 [Xylaria arbuscula]